LAAAGGGGAGVEAASLGEGSGAVRAIFTINSLPSADNLELASNAVFWSASLSNSTKPKPLDRPFLFLTTWALVTFWSLNNLESPSSSSPKGRLATKRVVDDGVRLVNSRLGGRLPPPPRLGPPPRGPEETLSLLLLLLLLLF